MRTLFVIAWSILAMALAALIMSQYVRPALQTGAAGLAVQPWRVP